MNQRHPRFLALLIPTLLLCQIDCARGAVVLGAAGKAVCSIVVPPDALELEQLAARELADHLEQVIGGRPQTAQRPRPGANIYVGRSPEIDALVNDVDFEALGADGILLRTVGNDLVLSGGRPRGVLFAVYTFLQDEVGYRWFAPDETRVPSKPSLAVSDLNVVYRPPFDLRSFPTGALSDGKFALRLRHNGYVIGFNIGDHSMYRLLPPEEHFLEHPDWYAFTPVGDKTVGESSYDESLERLKTRAPQAWIDLAIRTRRLPDQPCTSSAGALEATTRSLLAELEAKYPDWTTSPKVVWVSQNNTGMECKCDLCLVKKRREDSASASWIAFVNAIAARVAEKYPDVLVATMAFLHTEKPPAHLGVHPNVLVYSCAVTSDRKRPLTEVPQGQWVARWCDIARHVYIWDHVVNYWRPIPPHPNHFVMGPNLRFFAEQGVKGLMLEGKGGNVGELQRMRAYVACRLMWDPSEDQEQLMAEFLDGYYGAAGPYLMKWILLQREAALRNEQFALSAYTLSTKQWLTFEDLSDGMGLFQRALTAVAGNAGLEHRVRHARLSLDVVWLERYQELRAAAVERGAPYLGPDDPMAELERIEQDEFGLAWPQFPQYLKKLRDGLGANQGRTP